MIAGALLTGNYGMWNAYAVVMMILYAPPAAKGNKKWPSSAHDKNRSNCHTFFFGHDFAILGGGGAGDSGTQRGVGSDVRVGGQEGDPATLQKFITKTSQE